MKAIRIFFLAPQLYKTLKEVMYAHINGTGPDAFSKAANLLNKVEGYKTYTDQ